jgi:hypothetical protein
LVLSGDSSLRELGNAFPSQIEKDVGVKVVLEDTSLGGLGAGKVLHLMQGGDTPNLKL